MKISIITAIYNEEMLLPFFLKHYCWADEIHVLLDKDTTDKSLDICTCCPNVIIHDMVFHDMMDAEIKQKYINHVFNSLYCDWVIVADCDEFIFPISKVPMREVFSKSLDGNVVYAHMWPVYRHSSENDLDVSIPVYEQRRHGDPNMNKGWNGMYVKPCIARRDINIVWGLGCHDFKVSTLTQVSNYQFCGAHWKMADPSLAIHRRINNGMKRQSRNNLMCGYQIQDHNITKEMILLECTEHLNDPILF